MLAKKFRITGEKDFQRVQDLGNVYQSKNFGIAILDRKDSEPSRFAFIVSLKIAREAVDRNRFKRIMSEAVRTSFVDIKNGFDVVFLAKTIIIKCPTDELMREVKEALRGSGLIK